MAKRAKVKASDFVAVFAPMAKSGKSALEIGKAMGFTGTDKEISQQVSSKATILRTRLKENAMETAKVQKLDKNATDALVAKMANYLPRIKGTGRKSEVGDLVAAIDAALASMDAPTDEVEDEVEAGAVDTPAEDVVA